MEPFLGQLMLVGFNFAPRGWAFCNGQLLSIAQNTALFSLLGTTYGGDGITTFALPDLRGRTPLHFGQGPGLSNYVQGEASSAGAAGAEAQPFLVLNWIIALEGIFPSRG
ncbi:MAG: tail fiber protein [Pseudomonadota bacterium]|nr:tail fiber protein [Pseudomonadota bacterium]